MIKAENKSNEEEDNNNDNDDDHKNDKNDKKIRNELMAGKILSQP